MSRTPPPSSPSSSSTKAVLITTGATYPFPSLVRASLSPAVLDTLISLSYTEIRIQHGTSTPLFSELLPQALSTYPSLSISGFDFVEDMRAEEVPRADLVISHAGAGSVLDALRYQKRLLVVVNEELMDNHQRELARELQKTGYLIAGTCGTLANAIRKAVEKQDFTQFPRSGSEKFVEILEEEMGLLEVD